MYRNPHFLQIIQSAYYLLTAIWPIIHIDSFMYVTGCKTDIWLVKTVSVMFIAIALPVLYSSVKREISVSTGLLSGGTAAGLLFIDCYYSLNGTISLVYLADAGCQAVFLSVQLFRWMRRN